MKKTVLWVTLVLVAFSPLSTADHLGDERSATFVGSANVKHRLNEECSNKGVVENCPVRIPHGYSFVTCDGGDGHEFTAGLYDGIAAVRFCEVPRDAQIELEFVRLSGFFSTIGIVTCPEEDWDFMLGQISEEGPTEFEVHAQCNDESGSAHQDTTYITVYLRTANSVDTAVYAPVEGEIALRILSTGGSA